MKLLVKSKLNGRNLVTAFNIGADAVIRYSAVIVGWIKAEFEELDQKTRKMMKYGALHPKANVVSATESSR